MKKGKGLSSLFLILAGLFFIIPIVFSVIVGNVYGLLSTQSAISILISTMCIIISAVFREKTKKLKKSEVIVQARFENKKYGDNDYDLCV